MTRVRDTPWTLRTPMMAVAVMVVLIGGVAAAGRVNAQGTDDPVALRELVARGLGGDGSSVELLVGKLPDVRLGVSVPPGWRLIGTILRPLPTGVTAAALQGSASVYLDAPVQPTDALAKLATELSSTGWRRLELPVFNAGGFQVGGVARTATLFLCATDQGFLNASAVQPASTSVSRVTVTILTGPGFGPPCTTASPVTVAFGPGGPGVFAQLPVLVLRPDWTVVARGGGSGSSFSAGSVATVDGCPPPGETLMILEPQLGEAGWKRIGGATDLAIASSVWRKMVDSTEYQAVLNVQQAIGPERRCDLSINVSTKADASSLPSLPFGAILPPTSMVAPIAIAPTIPAPRAVATKKASVPRKTTAKRSRK